MAAIDSLCVELTQRCPLQCVHCSANAHPGALVYFPKHILLRVFSDIGSLVELYLSGGEPLEHPDIIDIIESARGICSSVVVYSSGTYLDECGGIHPLDHSLLSAAKDAGLSRLDLSIYSSEGATHDAITGVAGSLSSTINSAERARDVGLQVGIHYVPIGKASSHVHQVAALAAALGAVRLHVLALTPQGRARSQYSMLTPEPRFLEDLTSLAHRRGAPEIILSSELRQRAGLAVATPRDWLKPAFLDARGYLYPSEGQRQNSLRTKSSLLAGSSFADLLEELSTAAIARGP